MLAVFALLLLSVLPVYADGHWHGGHGFGWGVWVGPGWGGPWWWGPPYYSYYPNYPYYTAPAVIQQQPSQYIEPAPQEEEQVYWYFCPDAKNYYPYIKRCPSGWLRVIPPPAPADESE